MRRAAPGRQPSGARPPPPARAGRWLSGRWLLGLALLATLLPGVAAAHDGQAAESGEVLEALGAWSFDVPGTVLLLAVVGLYGWGFRRLRRTAPRFQFPRWHLAAFGGGSLLLLIVLNSPIDTYSDDLFWVHMVQHMTVVMLAAPLLLLGAPLTLALRSSSERVRRASLVPLLRSRAVQILTYPPVALTLFVSSIWIWHIPTLYEAAINSGGLHFVEHTSFLFGALLFWWLIIGVDATHLRPRHVTRTAILVLAILQNIGLALILTNLGEPIYESYEVAAALREWGPSALTDQRIGAGVMWVPGAMMFALAILATFYYWAEHEGFEGRRGDMLRDLEKRHVS